MFRVLLVAALVAPAVAQEEGQYSVDVEKAKEIVTAEEKQPDGWHYKLVLGANGSYTHNSSVVGLEDGSYVQIGIFLDGELTLRSGQHTWRNTLGIKYQQGKTPTIDPWVKSADELKFISLYRYALESVPWMGPFARFRLTTSMFPSEVVRAADATVYNASEIETPINDRTTGEALAAQDTAEITGAFEPLILRETVGLFALPIESKKLNIEVSLGAGAQEVFTSGGRTFKEEKEEDVRDANGMVTGDKQLSIFLTDLPPPHLHRDRPRARRRDHRRDQHLAELGRHGQRAPAVLQHQLRPRAEDQLRPRREALREALRVGLPGLRPVRQAGPARPRRVAGLEQPARHRGVQPAVGVRGAAQRPPGPLLRCCAPEGVMLRSRGGRA